jgi:YHS domain-containing protein
MPDTSRTRRPLAAAVLLLAAFLVPGLAFAAEGKGKTALQRVETKKVCMINNQVFDKDQIPVQVEGRTYYGCCEMCREKLTNDPASRLAVDPVTGKKVDKAKAVIAALPDGSVLYFESAETMAKYKAPGA